jgi:predicted nucleic acid-binding protein
MKDSTIFVDTGAWYALADRTDQHHKRAVKKYPALLRQYPHLTTTNLVVAETYFLVRRVLGHQPAISFLENLSSSPRITKIYSDLTLEFKAETILAKYQDQDFSYTDAVSFAVMRELKIGKAFAFDSHFSTAGFATIS